MAPPKHVALMTYRTANVGDDIQSLAALQFIEREPYLVNRERLAAYRGKPVRLLLNGWFCHRPATAWPPAPQIRPLLIGMHIQNRVYEEFARPESRRFLQRYGPVGCRDVPTLQFLQSCNVPAFLSLCLTLTFDAYGGPRTGVYLVDLPERLARTLPPALLARSMRRTHVISRTMSPLDRFARAAQLLHEYQRAELVLTRRLHCALPCVAFGTPVVLVLDGPRARGYEHLLSIKRPSDIRRGGDWQCDFAHLPPTDCDHIKQELRKHCSHFMSALPADGHRLASEEGFAVRRLQNLMAVAGLRQPSNDITPAERSYTSRLQPMPIVNRTVQANDNHGIAVSLIVTCKDRLHHLMQTLPKLCNQEFTDPIELIVIDYGCPQRTYEWCKDQRREMITSVRVMDETTPFNLSRARNIGARIARGAYLAFVDADVIAHPRWLRTSIDSMKASDAGLARKDRRDRSAKGLSGTLVVKAALFYKVRGFDEAFNGWGLEDDDFFWRCKRFTPAALFPCSLLRAISHSDAERVKHYRVWDIMVSRRSNRIHLKHRGPVVNPSGYGCGKVTICRVGLKDGAEVTYEIGPASPFNEPVSG